MTMKYDHMQQNKIMKLLYKNNLNTSRLRKILYEDPELHHIHIFKTNSLGLEHDKLFPEPLLYTKQNNC